MIAADLDLVPLQIVLALKLIEQILAHSRSHLDSHQQVRGFSQSSAHALLHAKVCTAVAAPVGEAQALLLID